MNPNPLSIVTVVRNDPEGLKQTLDSAAPLRSRRAEHWVIDGSSDDRVRTVLKAYAGDATIHWISESDSGIYDAMNKGLARATGDYVLFLNAGDIISPRLDLDLLDRALREADGDTLIGHTVEIWNDRKWLRPGVGREQQVFVAPPHQATFYPRRFYATERYRLDIRIAADCNYTERAVARCGASYLPATISEFALGGLSSSYGRLNVLKLRFRETHAAREWAKLLLKIVLWRVLPRATFYRFLAAGRYTDLSDGRPVLLAADRVQRRPPLHTA